MMPSPIDLQMGIVMSGFYSPCRLREGEGHYGWMNNSIKNVVLRIIGNGEEKDDTIDKLTISGFAAQFSSSASLRQESISIVDHGTAVSASNRTAIELKRGVVRKYWEWRGDK